MSGRRGRNKAQASALSEEVAEIHSSLDTLDIDTDPVISSIRFGMDAIMKIVNDTVPRCPDDEDYKQEVVERIETALLRLVEAELTHAQTNTIVNQVVDELELEGNTQVETSEFIDSVLSIEDISNERIADYKKTLTEDVLRAHPTFLKMKTHLESLMEGNDPSETYNAETETEEVDLEESFGGDQEVIPELDPITKKPLQDPVRNRICRHVYGKAAMLELIKANQRFRCPQMGCGNKTFIRTADLVDDPQLTARFNGEATASCSGSSSGDTSPPKSGSAKKGGGAKRGRRGRRRRR